MYQCLVQRDQKPRRQTIRDHVAVCEPRKNVQRLRDRNGTNNKKMNIYKDQRSIHM